MTLRVTLEYKRRLHRQKSRGATGGIRHHRSRRSIRFCLPRRYPYVRKAFPHRVGEHTRNPSHLKSSNGTLLNGHGAAIALLRNGDTVLAGNTSFSVQTAQETAERSPPPLPPRTERDHKIGCCPCFATSSNRSNALLDAAAEPSVLKVLLESKEDYRSLYQGHTGAQLTILPLTSCGCRRNRRCWRRSLRQGWGKNWVFILTSDQSLEECASTSPFSDVDMPDGKQVYFRFTIRGCCGLLTYCNGSETEVFFGPIQNCLVEDEIPSRCFVW